MKNANMKVGFQQFRALGVCFLLSLLVWGCNDPELIMTTTDDVNITAYLEREPEQYSEFLKILERTGNASFLAAYGTYTIFVPTNEAVKAYLQEKGVSSVDQVDMEELKGLVRFHLIEDTVSTTAFTDGKILTPTMYGQYLTTGAANINGKTSFRLNKESNILQGNIKAGNGVIHVVDKMMEPAKLTLAQMVEANPAYSIFAQALKATGFYAKLNVPAPAATDPNEKWFTLIAESNETLAKVGINSFNDLKARYSKTNDPTNPQDSLYLFVAYHILPDIKYVADIVTGSSHETVAPLEVITTRVDGTQLLINADVFNGVQEEGSSIVREKSDFSATNGVLHDASDHFRIKVRLPIPIYWDVADQPELRKMVAIFRKPSQRIDLQPGTFADVLWPKGAITYESISATSSEPYAFGDFVFLNLRPAVIPDVTFKTPLLVKGKYKVWVCVRRVSANDIQVFFNDVPFPRLVGLNPAPGMPGGATPEEAEAQGFKTYTWPESNNYVGRMIGTIDVQTTDRHDLKFLGLTNRGGSTGNAMRLDMVHFIPSDMEQIWPKFQQDGTPVYKP